MNFDYYTDQPVQLAVALVNSYDPHTSSDELTDAEAVRAFLARQGVQDIADEQLDDVADGDLDGLRALRESLREVFEAGDDPTAAERLNRLLRRSGAVPRISGHDARSFHLHFEPLRGGIVRWLGAVTAMGLTVVLCDHGFERFGVCASNSCSNVFVDETKNRRKRYCSDSCAHRASVAAYRARRRVEPGAPTASSGKPQG